MKIINSRGENELSKEVCLKFKLKNKPQQNSQEPIEFYAYTQKHSSYVLHNYNLLGYYIQKFRNEMISVNNVYCCRTIMKTDDVYFKRVSFWVEDFLPNFDTFYNNKYEDHIDKILTTRVSILKDLQEFIYKESGYRVTVIDLQGRMENNHYTLCDVEFTHIYTHIYICIYIYMYGSSLYDLTPDMLLDRYGFLNFNHARF
jgi:hypothetical protein